MPRPRKTTDEITEGRERILEVALQILEEEGYHALTIRAIAEKLGVSHMSLYTYFHSRDSLVEALSQSHQQEILERQRAWLERAKHEDIESLLMEIFSAIRQHIARRDQFRLTWDFSRWNLPASQPIPEGSRPDHFLARIIAIGIDRGVLRDRDPEIAAAMILGLINGPLMAHHSRHLFDLQQANRVVDEGIELVKQYLITGYENPSFAPGTAGIKDKNTG